MLAPSHRLSVSKDLRKITGAGRSVGGSLLARCSAAEMLRGPLLARGAGIQLKRAALYSISVQNPCRAAELSKHTGGLASIPVPLDLMKVGEQPPTIARLRTMTVYEVMCGRHLFPEGEEPLGGQV